MVAKLSSVGERCVPGGVLKRAVICAVVAWFASVQSSVHADDRDPCLDNLYPVASAGADQTVTAGTTVTFNSAGSYDPDGRDLTYYIWYFGDGQVGRGEVVSHTYHEPGTYSVRLTVTDDCRTRGSDAAIVVVTAGDSDPGDDPCEGNLAPVASISGTFSGEIGETILFRGHTSYDVDGEVASYSWTFGDGTAAAGSVVGHAFASPGMYNVTLTVTDDCGATDVSVMSVSITEVVDPCAGNSAPIANAGPNRSAQVGESVLFSGAYSSDSDGEIVSYYWRFGDNTASVGRNVAHTYDQSGTYYVVLRVTDDCGASSSRTIVVWVNPPADPCAGNQAPTAHAGDDRAVEVGGSLTLDASRSSDPDLQDQLTFSWNFDDGSVGSGLRPAHTFSQVGLHVVTLTVTDECGASDQDTVLVDVFEWDNADELSVTASPSEVRVTETINFTAATPADLAGRVYYRWDFGDGSYPGYGNASQARAFGSAGTYEVNVTLINKTTWQIEGAASTNVTVNPALELVGFLAGNLTYNNGLVVIGDNAWVVGDPPSVNLVNVSDPENPRLIWSHPFSGQPVAIATNGQLVAVGGGFGGILLFDATRPAVSTPMGFIESDVYGDRFHGLAFVGDMLVARSNFGGVGVYNMSDPHNPVLTTSLPPQNYGQHVVAFENIVGVTLGNMGVQLVDFSDPSNPVLGGVVEANYVPATINGFAISRVPVAGGGQKTLLALSQSQRGVDIWDISDLSRPVKEGVIDKLGIYQGVFIRGQSLFCGFLGGVWEYDIADPRGPKLIGFATVSLGGTLSQLWANDRYVFTTVNGNVLGVVDTRVGQP